MVEIQCQKCWKYWQWKMASKRTKLKICSTYTSHIIRMNNNNVQRDSLPRVWNIRQRIPSHRQILEEHKQKTQGTFPPLESNNQLLLCSLIFFQNSKMPHVECRKQG
ncbi:hypothetical protein T06_2540 [Trichinella sp. T6]|nr:hypothetical protein T06_2540 [Trichinella sp. T6]KRX81118.1 hypothetical protein T06_2540 [Trichinella sp. T6]KRX81119.1 hypothetical protein T06_2540 [Trichinella sp. T6]